MRDCTPTGNLLPSGWAILPGSSPGAADSLPVVVPLCRPQMLLKALRSAIVLPSERNWARIDLPLQLISAK